MEWLPTAIEWIQAHWADIGELGMLIWAAVSIVVKATPSKADDAWLRRWAERLSFLGPRGDRLLSMPGAKPPVRKRLDGDDTRPPRPPMPPAIAMLVVCLLMGCGPDRYRIHYEAATASHNALVAADEALLEICTVARLEAEGLEFGERCESAREAQHSAVEAWSGYVEAATVDGIDASSALSLGARVVAFYREVAQFLRSRGVNAPEIDL